MRQEDRKEEENRGKESDKEQKRNGKDGEGKELLEMSTYVILTSENYNTPLVRFIRFRYSVLSYYLPFL